MARNGIRSKSSMHQKIMNVLFGESSAKNIPTNWKSWPEPQRSIYSRLFANRYILVPGNEYKNIRKMLNNWYPNCRLDD